MNKVTITFEIDESEARSGYGEPWSGVEAYADWLAAGLSYGEGVHNIDVTVEVNG